MRYVKPISLFLSLSFLLGACAAPAKETVSGGLYVYDLSSDMVSIAPAQYDFETSGEDISECVRQLLQRMIDGPAKNRVNAAIPEEITDVTFWIGAQTVTVDLDSSFNDVSQFRRLLCEAAVVRTLCQLEDVYAVSFAVDGAPITDLRGNPIGVLTPDSFTGLTGSTLEGYERSELHLFFATEDGKSLAERVETVQYTADISPERIIVESLIAGPKSSDAFATINPQAAVDDVTTRNGICYVSLNREFLNKTTNVSDEVLIYSLVDSLTSLGNVNKVQIIVDGRNDASLGEYDLSKLYERNLEMIR